jgi:glucosamine--fructose-6-phosphate aminotransferase (isomerizing)
MENEAYATFKEITTQTKAWFQAIEVSRTIELPDPSDYNNVIFMGCGSTYYLSLALASLYQTLTGVQSRAVPGSEMLLNSQVILSRNPNIKPNRTLLVAISRSGSTTETVKAVENFRNKKLGDVIVISNYEEILSRFADLNIVIPEGQEISVAQTRSFASMYVAGTVLCARMAYREDLITQISRLPILGEQLIRDFHSFAKRIGEDLSLDSFYFLGSGLQYGLACELSLKFKEMTLTQSEPFHFMEYRHGPMSMVNETVGIFGLVSETNFTHEMKVVSEMRALRGRLFTVGESGTDVIFNSQIPEQVRGVLYLPIMQLTAFYRSVQKGLNPDSPRNLSAVVNLDL